MAPKRQRGPLDRRDFLSAGGLVLGALASTEGAPAPLPSGVQAVWDLGQAYQEKTTTRQRVCLNGLWRWQPGQETADTVPTDGWGYYKVPAFWPGNANYILENCQTLHPHPTWKDADLRVLSSAWYQRELTVPEDWAGRRITLAAEYVNSFAVVFVDGRKVGEIRFPGGEADLSAVCRPGGRQVLSLLVLALPLKGVLLSFTDTNSAREVKGTVERRGLCGDIWLTGTPAAARITDVKINTSVRQSEITVSAALEGLSADASFALRVKIEQDGRLVREFASKPFLTRDLEAGRFTVRDKWLAEKLWDLHTPGHTFDAVISLVDAGGRLLDAFHPVRSGFREFWIDGRDFFLNGTRLHLSAVPLDNAQLGSRTATYEGAVESLKRLQSFGINFVYTHNYVCVPGSHVSFAEVLRAADDVGMLVAFSQPHFAHYDWKVGNADRANGYARHAEFYVRAAQNHPAVVAYSMSHNATGYDEDMNPDQIDGCEEPRTDTWSRNNAALALRAEAIVSALDPSRIVYHHSSGNLGSMHTMNFYLNFVPIQEVSDWFEHWATRGVKPVFPCEYGVPFSWDWGMYRGWYKGQREWGSAKVPWEFCLAEWNAQFLGDRAFRISEAEKKDLRWEARQFRAGTLWHRWDEPHTLGSSDFADQHEVFARYFADNWRAHRTWGISANSPWEYATFWKLRDGVERRRKDLKVNWDALQKPGFSPDFVLPRQGSMSLDGERADWLPTTAAQALLRNNRPLLAWIGGKPSNVDKQLILINNSRATVSCDCSWSLQLPEPVRGQRKVVVRVGEQERVPLRFELPATLAAGNYELSATCQFSTGETQQDSFTVHVLPGPASPRTDLKIALFDPKGETARLLTSLDVRFDKVEASTDLSHFDVLIIGKEALTSAGPGPDVSRVRDGLKVVVFEQTAAVLEERFGFRVTEYGLRQVFRRVLDHPLLAGFDTDHLRDWLGSATLLPPRLKYTLRPRYGPTVRWCGIEVTRPWRVGCRGNVASVLLEKPARGDFLPILDGGFGLQYSPLLEYREGQGMALFCQVDVTGRTEAEPAAAVLVRNLIRYLADWKPSPRRKALYVGDAAGKKHLEAAGLSLTAYAKVELAADRVLIVAPGGGKDLAEDKAVLGSWLQEGGSVLALGLDEAEAQSFLPIRVGMKQGEHIAAYFEPPGAQSPFVGIGPADVHNRDPRELPLVTAGATIVGNGVLAKADDVNVVFCQLVPWLFDPKRQMNLKRTFRRASGLVSRLAANLGVTGATPLLARFRQPVEPGRGEQRWLEGLYLDTPEEWDDPYRFFRW
jgi:beta-galactosidase